MRNTSSRTSGRTSSARSQSKKATPAKASMPQDIMPMLATLVSKPVGGDEWIYEVKWDGYRALGYVSDGGAEIRSRNNKVFTEKYYPITEALTKWGIDAVVDGELVVLAKDG